MSSSVFFRFKSQKEPQRITFDGTGISVFELKREIISVSKLGDGTDFELIVSSEDGDEVYDDDTTIIPRSTTVIAKRLPAAKGGRVNASRYVSGKMPVNARNSHRSDLSSSKPGGKSQTNNGSSEISNFAELKTEEERIAAMFQLSNQQWEQQQQEMAHATPVHRAGPMKGKPVNLPDRPPPPGYICYRCGEKGHWIQVCPTNDDPKFDGRLRIKRTTGIPRSFLKTVEKPTALVNDGTVDDSKHPSGVMVNADGEYVIAEPDQASWEQFKAKAKVSATAQEAAARGSKELQDRKLECTIDKRLFIEPTKTPCCQTTYCNECITNALLDNDFQCPGCGKNGILIDDLVPDNETAAKICSYEEEKSAAKKEREQSKSPVVKQETPKEDVSTRSKSKSPSSTPRSSPSAPTPVVKGIFKKRSADSELKNNRTPLGPTDRLTNVKSLEKTVEQTGTKQIATSSTTSSFPAQLPFSTANFMPGLNAISMGPMMGITPGMMNPMMMISNNPFMNGMSNWGNVGFTGFPQFDGVYSGNFQNGMMPNLGYGQPNSPMSRGAGGMGMNGTNTFNQGTNAFVNQQRTTFSSKQPSQEDSAYFRQPVNPHRHQGRRNMSRPADYREI